MLKDIALSSGGVGIAILLLVALTVGLILYFKNHYRKQTGSNLTDKYSGHTFVGNTSARTKYPEVDIFKQTGPLLKYGLAAALALVLFTFSWTKTEKTIFIPDDAMAFEEEMEIEPPRTAEPPPPPPPQPKPVIEEVPDELIEEEEQPVFESQEIDVEEVIIDAPVQEDAPPPPPPPPPPAEEEIFKVVEQMPRFPGCEKSGSQKDKAECAQKKMLQYIYKNLKYPVIAKENGVQGTVVLQFVVDKTGSIKNVNILRDIGAGCGKAAEKVIKGMNKMGKKWTPGKQRGKAVKVFFTLPIKFKLEG